MPSSKSLIICSLLSILGQFGGAALSAQTQADSSEALPYKPRIEFVLNNTSSYELMPTDTVGWVLMQRQTARQYQFAKYDRSLNVLWETALQLPHDASFIGHSYHAPHLWLLYEDSWRRTKYCVRINTELGSLQVEALNLTRETSIEQWQAVDDGLYLLASLRNQPLLIYLPEDNLGEAKLNHLEHKGNLQVHTIQRDEQTGYLLLTAAYSYRVRETGLIFRAYQNGALRHEQTLVSDDEHHLLSGYWLFFPQLGKVILIGLYAQMPRGAAQGVFFAETNNPEQAPRFRYFHFDDFVQYFANMPTKRYASMRKKIQQKRAKDKHLLYTLATTMTRPQVSGNHLAVQMAFARREQRRVPVSGTLSRSPLSLVYEWRFSHALIGIWHTQTGRLEAEANTPLGEAIYPELEAIAAWDFRGLESYTLYHNLNTYYWQHNLPEKSIIRKRPMDGNSVGEKAIALNYIKMHPLGAGTFLCWGEQQIRRGQDKKVFFVELIQF